MSATNGEETKMMKKPSREPTSISSLPDDLIVSCLARVSILYHPILSLVSKRFRSLLASPELYQTRISLNRTESCLYVCLQFPFDSIPRWFRLCKKPNQTLTMEKEKEKEKSSGYVLGSIRILNSPSVEWSNLVAVGSNLYAITEEESPPLSTVSFLDCRTHTWLEAPSMRIAHADCVKDTSYLAGSCENPDSVNCVEVFNTETQTWNPVPPEKWIFRPGNMEGKIYTSLAKDKGLALKLKEWTWELVERRTALESVCAIENIKYRYRSTGEFEWCRFKSCEWRKLQGLEGLPKFAGYSNVRLVSYGGKFLVLWDEDVPATASECNEEEKKKMIWFAEIAVEKRNNGQEIWGKVVCFDSVLTVSKSYKFLYAIAAPI